ncbi:MAG TPA: MMPL family transporter [Candidatus Dormibacteraeota bacterium]|nr:MMPL family transporter [Candidatus Dormibacteraeota bacterium]
MAIGLLATILLGLAAWHVRIEASMSSILRADDPGVQYYDDVRAAFGSDDIAVVGVRATDIFAPATLEKIARVTDQLAAIKGVERVLSLTNTVDPAADVFNPPPLLPAIPPSAADIAALKAKLAATPLYAQNLVAPDGNGAAINVVFRPMTDAEYADLGIDERIAEILAGAGGPEQFVYTGVSRITRSAVTLMRRDLVRFTPIAVACVMAVLWFAFRRFRAVVLPLVTVILAVIWTLGVMALVGIPISLGTFMLPPLLLVVGSAQAMHVIAAYYEQVRRGNRSGAVAEAVHAVWAPLLISTVTVAVGFGALTVSGIVAVRDLGVMAVIGVLLSTVSSLGFLPAALALWSQIARSGEPAPSPRVETLMVGLGGQAYAARGSVLTAAAVVAVLAAIGTWRIFVDSDFLAYFDSRSDVRRDHELINQQIVGSNPFYLIVEGGAPGTMRRWEVLKKIKELQTFIGTLDGVSGSISLVDYLELLEKGLNKSGEGDVLVDEQGHIIEGTGGAPQSFWENSANLPPVLNLMAGSPSTFRAVVNEDFSRASIVVRSKVSGSREIEAMLRKIRDYVADNFPAGLRVVPTGSLVLITGTSSSMVFDQIKSVSLALLVIFAVMALMLLSARIGLLAILPNVLAIDVFFGILGWGQLPLNLGTSLIATMALGMAVDSSVHYMWRLSRELRGEADQAAAIQRTLRAVGGPMLYITLALAAGFLAFAGSGFPPIRHFGVLTAITLATAFAANLVVLPALLATTKIITLWDLLRVKLGRDFTSTIPLLAGLRPAQARIVVLMGELRRFPPGAPIVRAGEEGNEMFVILSGATDVYVRHDGSREQVAEFRRGDVFGEMALVRNEERSADVEARDAVEVLAVDERFLQRIQRRYPRIAARVFLNLTRILSDRLQRMNERLQ